VAWRPDGRAFATSSRLGQVQIWDTATGDKLTSFKGSDDAVFGLAWSPDGLTLAAVGRDRTLRLWDVAAGRSRDIVAHDAEIYGVAYSPAGDRVATASADRRVRIWDQRSGQQIGQLVGHNSDVRSVAFGPGGSIVSASSDTTVRRWTTGGSGTAHNLAPVDDAVLDVAVAPKGDFVAAAVRNGTVATWSLPGGTPGPTLTGHVGTVFAVTVMPSGQVASAGFDGSVRVWDPSSTDPNGAGRVVDTIGNEVRAMAWSPDGGTLAVAGADGRIRRYGAPDWEPVGRVLDHGAEIRDLAYTGDGTVLASAGRDLVVRLWQGDDALAALSPQTSDVRAVAFLPGDDAAVSASNDGRVKVWPAPKAWAATACKLAGRDLRPEEWDRFAAGVTGPRPTLC
jgi:WD40 repeat protein